MDEHQKPLRRLFEKQSMLNLPHIVQNLNMVKLLILSIYILGNRATPL